MKFDLKRPCADCPFRSDIPGYLTKARVRQILRGIIDHQATFSCHKTNEFVTDDDGETITVEPETSQHCAGAMILLERLDRPNQMMRIAERLGLYDRKKLHMDSPVFPTMTAMIGAQRR